MLFRISVAISIYFGEVVALLILSRSPAAYEGWGSIENASPSDSLRSVLLLAAVAIMLDTRPSSIRQLVLWWLFATVLAPAWVIADWTTLFPAQTLLRGALLTTLGYLTMLLISRKAKAIQIVAPVEHSRHLRLATLTASLAAVAALILSLGIPTLSDLSLETVYGRREEYRSTVSALGGYLTSWTSFVLVPALISLAYRDRSLLMGAIGAAAGLLVYAWVGAKNAVLIVVLSLALCRILSNHRQSKLASLPSFLVVLVSLPTFVYLLFGADQLIYLISRRALLVPAVNSMAHLQHGMSLGEQSGSGWLSSVTGLGEDSSVYGSGPVGNWLQPGSGLNANSHLLAFPMQWNDVASVIAVAVAASALLWLLDSLAMRRDPRIAVVVGSVVCFNLSESYLHTALLTGGISLALILILLAPGSVGAQHAQSHFPRHSREPSIESVQARQN